jgi:hypothetical protein
VGTKPIPPIKFEITAANFVPHTSHPPSFIAGSKEHISQAVHKPAPKMKIYNQDILVIQKWPEVMATKELRYQNVAGINVCTDWPVVFHRWSENALYVQVQYPTIGAEKTIISCIGKSMIQTAIQQYLDGSEDPAQQFGDNLAACLTAKGIKWADQISVRVGIRTDPGPWQAQL